MKSRRFHTLQGNKASQRPQHVIFFDTETRPIPISPGEDKHVLRLGWACYHRPQEKGNTRNDQWFSFSTTSEFWEFVENRCKEDRRLYLVAHNVAFDLRIVKGFSYLSDNGWEEKFTYDKGLTTILRYTKGKQTLEILSTTNFFAMSLKKLGALVGLEKKEVSFDKATTEELLDYCRRDVEIILRAWLMWVAFLDKHDLGTFRRTISSQAFSAYRHRFMTTPITIHGNMDVCAFEREAYRGGRVECFKVGIFSEEPYYYVDVNGMYAYQMETRPYPYKLCGHTGTLPVRSLRNKLRNFSVIARVVVSTTEPAFVTRHDKRNVYPTGTFEVVLTTPELKYALDNNMVKEVREVSWYNQAYIFKGYTNYFTALKEQYEKDGNLPFRGIAKLYINALYGKFGQTAEKPKQQALKSMKEGPAKSLLLQLLSLLHKKQPNHLDIDMGIINRDTGEWVKPLGFHRNGVSSKTPEETYNSFPAIVAHVTAYARHYLWSLILAAGRKNTFYCDTDSLIVNQRGLDNLSPLLHPTKAGYLKVEKQGQILKIYAPKDYVIGDRVRQKGIRGNAIEVSEGEYRQDQFLGLAGAKRRGNTDLVIIKQVVKNLRREIKTGVVESDGWVTPLHFPL